MEDEVKTKEKEMEDEVKTKEKEMEDEVKTKKTELENEVKIHGRCREAVKGFISQKPRLT